MYVNQFLISIDYIKDIHVWSQFAHRVLSLIQAIVIVHQLSHLVALNPFMPTVPTFAVRETVSLGIMGEPRVPPLNPSETIVL